MQKEGRNPKDEEKRLHVGQGQQQREKKRAWMRDAVEVVARWREMKVEERDVTCPVC